MDSLGLNDGKKVLLYGKTSPLAIQSFSFVFNRYENLKDISFATLGLQITIHRK